MQLLTLLSDFGWQDSYVGILKGVILGILPTATIVDLTHGIPPQDIAVARFQLLMAYAYFPPGAIHVAIVDPGVGSQRRAIAVQTENAYFVAPDNGLLSGVLAQQAIVQAVELTNADYWRSASPSTTFHGRDIFAPVAAYLAKGIPIEALGTPIDPASLVQLQFPLRQLSRNTYHGCIQAIDHFGNLITNFPAAFVQGWSWQLQFQQTRYPGQFTYADVRQGSPIGLIGSHGYLELAINRGNAQAILQAEVGDTIELQMSD
ncbi:SAM-dependent chlorinase/fluorinase [Alkalinema sp. FACHB-956]|uniref:SAM hydrolase/SAM-dependent halogenase family protein n=1 Tax=Alkalinema sp. FACHB-956 TaxID=2692768 RepID=UPI001684C442|nr:SAM-dependent chlorinase/fluorinase [Alkalinema sp. FACHB-956]MBD2329113.1 SAM-dependent chlorinase/fluorinase [Alkalinema sp. FACHB-956]